MAQYVLVDTANTFFRARHVVRGDLHTKVGMALHVTLNSVKKHGMTLKQITLSFVLKDAAGERMCMPPIKGIDKKQEMLSLQENKKKINYFGKLLIVLINSYQKRLTAQCYSINN